MTSRKKAFSPNMTILEIVSENRETIEVFKTYDEKAGECICCASLFETLNKVAEKYGIDLDEILKDLNNVT